MQPLHLFTFACLLLVAAAAAPNRPLLPIDTLRKTYLRLEDELEAAVAGALDAANEISKNSIPTDLVLIRKMQGFDVKLNQEFPHDINYGLDALQNSWLWGRASAELRTIYAMYEAFRRFQAQQTASGRIPSPQQAWIDFAETVLHDVKSNMPATMQKLHDLKINENLFLNALRETDGVTLCNIHESPQQMLLNLYNTAAATELKAYAMVQFSYMLLRLYGKGNFTHESEIMRDKYLQRSRETAEAIRDALTRASRQLWICDPDKYEKGKNYLEITELLQGYIQNEVDLNEQGTCRENCAEYKYTKSHSCYMNLYCKQQRRCNGKIIDCKFVDSDSIVCPAASGTNRRYDYVEYEDGRVYGQKKGGCSKSTVAVDSWWRWIFWHCSYCMCICDEQGSNSDRYISLQPVVTHTEKNKVATGLRFTKVGRIIHLQIQEGLLGKGGQITEVSWVPVQGFNITDRNVKNGVDFHTLTYESRAMDLDDLETDSPNQVLTGVRFQMLGTHLNFQIRLTYFDFVTGKLQPEKSYWKSNHNTDAARINPRRKLDLERRDIPTRSTHAKSQPDSHSDMYLQFTHTDFERDVAQTTIPYFDSQDVVSEMPMMLGGAGIYHKGLQHFGGFVAPKIITYNYHTLLENAIDDLNLDLLVN